MPFSSIRGAKAGNFPTRINDINLSLSQVNKLSEMYDAIKEAGTARELMAVAISQFKRMFRVEDGRFVRRDDMHEDEEPKFRIVRENGEFKMVEAPSFEYEVIAEVYSKEVAEKVLKNMKENDIQIDASDKTWRYDYEVISEKFIDKSTGFLRIPAVLTRTGVFVYRKNDDSVVKELRLPQDVFNQDSIDSLKSKPVTNNHPAEMITLDNAKQYMIGHVSDTVKHDGKFVNADVIINDKAAIPVIDKGKKQVSCGYTVDLEFKPGVYQGERYDAIQRNIRYNHVAIVDKARAGESAQLRLDNNDAEMVSADKYIKSSQEEENMKKLKIDGVEFEVQNDELAVVIETTIAKRDELVLKISEMEKDKTKTDEIETMKAKLDASEAKVKELESKIDENEKVDPVKEAVRTRIDVLRIAEKVCDAEAIKKFDEMEDVDIKKASLKAKDPELNLDEKSDTYIDARFDILKEEISKTDGTQKLGKKIVDGRKEGEEKTSEEARIESQKHDSEAYKLPCSATKK